MKKQKGELKPDINMLRHIKRLENIENERKKQFVPIKEYKNFILYEHKKYKYKECFWD